MTLKSRNNILIFDYICCETNIFHKMQKLLISASFIVGLVLIACANSTSNAKHEQAVTENQQENKPVLQFTPEEIAYNDSIKDIPQTYIITEEEITIKNINNPLEIEKDIFHKSVFLTQKDAYIQIYGYVCGGVMDLVSSYVRITQADYKDYTYKYSIKILNEDGKDIIPLLDFPERRFIEDSIWNSTIDFMNKDGIVGTIDMYHQPIFNKGDTIALERDTSFLKDLR